MSSVLFFGALTSKPYAFSSRPWELDSVETFDFFDSLGSRIRADLRSGQIMRILPRVDEVVNSEWISDKIRFSYDGFRRQRLYTPLARADYFSPDSDIVGRLYPISWSELYKRLSFYNEVFIKAAGTYHCSLGRFIDLETLYVLKATFLNGLGDLSTLTQRALVDNVDSRSGYLLPPVSSLLSSDLLLLVGSNLRAELPVLAARIRSFSREGGLRLFSIASGYAPLISTVELGRSLKAVVAIVEGRHPFSQLLISASAPVVLLGSSVINRRDGSSFYRLFSSLSATFFPLRTYLLIDGPSSINAAELGIFGRPSSTDLTTSRRWYSILYLLADDEIEFDRIANRFVVYQGHHGDRNAARADFVLPGGLPIEKRSTMVDIHGRYRHYTPICSLPGEARPDWQIVLFLYSALGFNFKELYPFEYGVNGLMGSLVEGFGSGLPDGLKPLMVSESSYPVQFLNRFILSPTVDYYLSDSVSRASKTMAVSSRRLYLDVFTNFKSNSDFC